MTSSDLHDFLDIGVERIPGAPCRRALSPSRLPGLEHSLNPYRGCAHRCIYCYAPGLLHIPLEEWERPLPKRGIARLLEKEAVHANGMVGVGTSTDPYQPLEAEERLTRSCLEVLTRHDLRACVHTKSDLVLRDLELLQGMEAGVTVTTVDASVARVIEPGAPSPQRRLRAIEGLVSSGVDTFVMVGPALSCIGDESELAEAIASTGVKRVIVDVLNRGTARAVEMEGMGIIGARPESVRRLKESLASIGLDVSDAF